MKTALSLQDVLLARTPVALQNFGLSLYNSHLYRRRHSGEYRRLKRYYSTIEQNDRAAVKELQSRRLSEFLLYVTQRSEWYGCYRNASLSDFPPLTKEQLILHFDKIRTIPAARGIVSYTGGTTGASLKVIYRVDDLQERFAILDAFRARWGYHLGKRVAWFSGKRVATLEQAERGLCYRDDFINRIRFFSTFHVSARTWKHYWRALEDFAPDYVVGFPSSVAEICAHARAHGRKLSRPVRAVFPTAETVVPEHRHLFQQILGGVVRDQYASSEGAPFIFECDYGRMHMHVPTGVFEVVDEQLRPARSGELLVTSFTTRGTPLVRYRVGDRVTLPEHDETCKCGSPFPWVRGIDGRGNDFVFSASSEKVNLGNLSNATKGVAGVLAFQIQQDEPGAVILLVVGSPAFDADEERRLVEQLRLRLGPAMRISVRRVSEIPRERGGKTRLVKNSLA